KQGLKYALYSSATKWQDEDVLLIDQVGILAEIYTWGNLAFVGGSFRTQVHSVMEPLAASLPVIVGPHHHNNREALTFKNQNLGGQPVVTEVKDTETLATTLTAILKDLPATFPASLRHELSHHMHSSQSVIEWCSQ